MFLLDTTIISESMNMSLSPQYPVWWVLSVLAVLRCLFDVLHTSIIHIFRCPHLTQHLWFVSSFRLEDHTAWKRVPNMISSLGEALVWMHIWKLFTHMNHLKQLLSVNNLSAVMKPLSKVAKNLWKLWVCNFNRSQYIDLWHTAMKNCQS